MQTIKGLIVLLLVAAVVFAIGAMNDIRSQFKYAAELRNPAVAKTAGTTTVNVVGSVKPGVHKTGEMAANSVGRVQNATTNVADQAKRKAPRT